MAATPDLSSRAMRVRGTDDSHRPRNTQETTMTTTIGTTTTTLPAIAAQPQDTPADAVAAHDGASIGDQGAGEHPLAKLVRGDLHAFAQPYAPAPGAQREVSTLLAPFQAPPSAPTAQPGGAIPLYDTQLSGGPGPQLAAPVKPGPPMALRQLEELNAKAQRYNINTAPKNDDLRRELGAAKQHLQAATDALRAGDYQKAANHLRHLGLPLPMPQAVKDGAGIGHAGSVTAILLGAPVQGGKGGAWQLGHVGWEKGGFKPLITLNSFAANATMIDRMSTLPGGVSNPPTEAQATQYMREFANPAKGPKPTPQQVMQAASEITNGMIIHYSTAGAPNPTYGATSPDAWSDIAAPGKHAGRHIGDCESKVYLQTRLLTAAGLTSLGSVNVEHGDNGHMFGVFKAGDGTIWITSNEEFKQVMPAKADNGKVTQEHLDYTLRNMTAEVYGVQPNYRGEFDGIKIGSAATANIKGSNDAAVASIQRSTEMTRAGRSEPLIPPPADKVKP
jgi:hypothetical protein